MSTWIIILLLVLNAIQLGIIFFLKKRINRVQELADQRFGEYVDTTEMEQENLRKIATEKIDKKKK